MYKIANVDKPPPSIKLTLLFAVQQVDERTYRLSLSSVR